jgi:hypothetical protein
MLRAMPAPEGVIGNKPVELARIYLGEAVLGRGYGAALVKERLKIAKLWKESYMIGELTTIKGRGNQWELEF